MLLNILVGIVGIVIGFIFGFLIKTSENSRIKKENENLQKKILELSENLSEKRAKLETLQNLKEILQNDFKTVAEEIIKSEQKDLREQNRETLEEKFKPLQRDFNLFKEKIEDFNKQGEVKTAELKIQIENLVQESKNVKMTADKLANAIRDNSKNRGDFGELILDNLLEHAGLINQKFDKEKGNYITQHKYTDKKTNKTIQPDAVIFFPDNKHIVIDSKCPLNNFQNYCNAESDEEKNAELKSFFNSVEDMINELGNKYNSLEGINPPEFTLMFLPLESCASYIYSNTDLLKKAEKKNVIIVCPSTLFATLKIINKVWQNRLQAENIKEIFDAFQRLYEKILIFVDKTKEIQKSLKNADNSFDELYKTAESKGGIYSQIEKLKDYGFISENRENTVKDCIKSQKIK